GDASDVYCRMEDSRGVTACRAKPPKWFARLRGRFLDASEDELDVERGSTRDRRLELVVETDAAEPPPSPALRLRSKAVAGRTLSRRSSTGSRSRCSSQLTLLGSRAARVGDDAASAGGESRKKDSTDLETCARGRRLAAPALRAFDVSTIAGGLQYGGGSGSRGDGRLGYCQCLLTSGMAE
ncbi:hypothetical protein BBJ28_00026056, partial [Nothophytophthora sp. Chile5]